MGFMDRMKQAQQQATAAQASYGGATAMPTGMGGGMADAAAMAQKLNHIGQVGVERPGTLVSMRPTGQTQITGDPEFELDVAITGADGAPYRTTIRQYLVQSTMGGLQEGGQVTLKVDPNVPTEAILWSW